MKKELLQTNWSSIFNAIGINDAVKDFSSILNETFTNHSPFISKRVKRKPSSWLNKETKTQIYNRDKVLRKARRTKDVRDWNIYKDCIIRVTTFWDMLKVNSTKSYLKIIAKILEVFGAQSKGSSLPNTHPAQHHHVTTTKAGWNVCLIILQML